ncbi:MULTISPECIES: hypothetical protein [Amycolatopsis]|uniref:Uncharacterized protein n=1 Tax=Amycolatopsis albidoflavus TaxID=102226 RepID=A0ABW5HS16_9PSEU
MAHVSADTTALYEHTDDHLSTDPAHLVAAATFAAPGGPDGATR